MATLTSQLIVSLIDRVSGPARQAAQALRGIGQAASGASVAALHDRVRAAANANAQALARMRAGMLDAAGAGYALYRGLQAPLSIAGQFETALLDIAQKADLSDAAMKALGARMRALAPMVNQSSQAVAAGMDVLLGMGLDPTRAEGILPVLGKTATAYRAGIDDLAKTGMAAIDNLKLKVEEMPKAMDMLAAAGKAGAFELKDMAQHLPALSAMAETNGMRGLSAILELGTALQIVRKGAGDSAQAATNLQNVLQKLTSPDVVGKFKKVARVDLKKAMASAVKGGMSPIEAIADITNRVIQKSKGKIKIGDLFGDLQMQLGMAALVNHLEEWRRIRAEVAKASGVVDADFERRMKTSAERTKAFTIRLREMGLTIGNILIPAMNGLMDSLSPVLRSIEAFAEANPALVGGAIKLAAALIGLRVAAIAARYAFLFLKGGALAALGSVLGAAVGVRRLAVAFKALGLLRVAALLAGVGAAVTALAAAGTLIYQNWEGLGAFFQAFGSSFMGALGPAADLVTPLIDAGKRLWDTFSGFFGEISPERWRVWGEGAGSAIGSIVAAVLALPGQIAGLATALFASGSTAMRGLWDGMKSVVDEMIAWVMDIPSRISGSLSALPGKLRALSGLGADNPAHPQSGRGDYTLGSYGTFQKGAATEIGTGSFGPMSARTARRAGSSPLGQMRLEVEDVGAKADAARNKLEGLSAPVKPNVDASDLINLLRLITQADAGLSRLGQRASAIRREVGEALRAGGQVRQAMRGVHADTSG